MSSTCVTFQKCPPVQRGHGWDVIHWDVQSSNFHSPDKHYDSHFSVLVFLWTQNISQMHIKKKKKEREAVEFRSISGLEPELKGSIKSQMPINDIMFVKEWGWILPGCRHGASKQGDLQHYLATNNVEIYVHRQHMWGNVLGLEFRGSSV